MTTSGLPRGVEKFSIRTIRFLSPARIIHARVCLWPSQSRYRRDLQCVGVCGFLASHDATRMRSRRAAERRTSVPSLCFARRVWRRRGSSWTYDPRSKTFAIASLSSRRQKDVFFDVYQRMNEHGVRAIPVLDDSDQVIGIVTLLDLLELMLHGGVDPIKSREVRSTLDNVVSVIGGTYQHCGRSRSNRRFGGHRGCDERRWLHLSRARVSRRAIAGCQR